MTERISLAFRIAFSTVNDGLGAHPDRELAAAAPAVVRDALAYGGANPTTSLNIPDSRRARPK
jgi:hypothetical protein